MRDADFERLYAEHARPLLAFLVYRTGDRALSEDLLADTFERVLTAKRGFDRRKASEKTWLYSIALNLVRDRVRRTDAGRRAMDKVYAGGFGTDRGDPFDSLDDRYALQAALQTLSREERDTVSLRYGGDLSVPEIARLTHEKLTTVEGRLYRALRKLKRELQ
jgi:RNA polymerase sigma-70 factor (ECF subfamily)